MGAIAEFLAPDIEAFMFKMGYFQYQYRPLLTADEIREQLWLDPADPGAVLPLGSEARFEWTTINTDHANPAPSTCRYCGQSGIVTAHGRRECAGCGAPR